MLCDMKRKHVQSQPWLILSAMMAVVEAEKFMPIDAKSECKE